VFFDLLTRDDLGFCWFGGRKIFSLLADGTKLLAGVNDGDMAFLILQTKQYLAIYRLYGICHESAFQNRHSFTC